MSKILDTVTPSTLGWDFNLPKGTALQVHEIWNDTAISNRFMGLITELDTIFEHCSSALRDGEAIFVGDSTDGIFMYACRGKTHGTFSAVVRVKE